MYRVFQATNGKEWVAINLDGDGHINLKAVSLREAIKEVKGQGLEVDKFWVDRDNHVHKIMFDC